MIRPFRDNVVIAPLPNEQKVGEIIIPSGTQDAANKVFGLAEVVAVGPTVKGLKVGDTVLASEFFGDDCKDEGQSLKIGRERDITGTIIGDEVMPVTDRVLMLTEPDEVRGGIILPTRQKGDNIPCRVVAVGPKCQAVRAGQRVFVPRLMASRVNYKFYRWLLLEEPSVFAVLED